MISSPIESLVPSLFFPASHRVPFWKPPSFSLFLSLSTDKPIYFIMNRGAFRFGLLQLPPFPPPNLPAYIPIPASPPSSSPLEPCHIIHALPLTSVSPSLTPSLSLQMSSHPQHPHSLFHLHLQLPFLLPSLLLFLYFLISSQFTAICFKCYHCTVCVLRKIANAC